MKNKVSDHDFSETYMYILFLKLKNLSFRSSKISLLSLISANVSGLLLISCLVNSGDPIEAFKVKHWLLLQILELCIDGRSHRKNNNKIRDYDVLLP